MKCTRWLSPFTRLRALRAVSMAQLVACAVLPSVASAQALPVQVPYGLNGTAAWRENIALGIDIWSIAHENARRTLLLGRCTALDRSFPARPAPAMVAASTGVFRWMIGEAYADLPPEPFSSALRDVLPTLAKHAFSAEELASWEAIRNSPQGQRGLAAHEVEAALMKVSDQLVDVSSGRYWSWPLARLVRLVDAHGFRKEVDATFEMMEPGTAARLREISLVPGETSADEGFLELVSKSGESLAEKFIKQLSASDKSAYERIERIGLLERWQHLAQALQQFAVGPEIGILRGQSTPATVPAFCDSVGLSSCQPGGEISTAITKYRAAFDTATRSDVPAKAARQIVRGLPSSGCS
jgi:hypothetical protein